VVNIENNNYYKQFINFDQNKNEPFCTILTEEELDI